MLLPAYVFIHVCIGEFVAFIIGWNLILDYIIGVALAAKGITAYLELLVFGNGEFPGAAIQPFTPKDWQILSSYFDFVAFFIPILIAGWLTVAGTLLRTENEIRFDFRSIGAGYSTKYNSEHIIGWGGSSHRCHRADCQHIQRCVRMTCLMKTI